MRLTEFDYHLPSDLIAQVPADRRDASRLMVLRRDDGKIDECPFARIEDLLRPGDLVVLNDTLVRAGRLVARKTTGGRVELLLVARDAEDPTGSVWCCMASSSKGMRPGARLSIAEDLEAEVLGEVPRGRLRIRFRDGTGDPGAAIRRHGLMPLPPYIERAPDDPRSAVDRERYQTVFARAEGAIAAPTAGLHFTEPLIDRLVRLGVRFARLTLHVGPGTFQPVRTERIEEHGIEPEEYRLPPETAAECGACHRRGGRVVAVGTTVTRVLESRARDDGTVEPGHGWCDLYITPGHRFRVVDALLTNLHLPRSSLLILVSAFAGRDRILAAYREAIRRRFRFYSYGDAMMIQ